MRGYENVILMTIEQFDQLFMVWIWLGIFVLCVIVEAVSVDFISIFFAGGALLALIASLIPGVPFWGEIIIFLFGSALLLLSIRPFIKKLFKKVPPDVLNIDGMIGKKCKVTKKITELEWGEVKCNGVLWTAMNKNKEEEIEEGAIVQVVGVDGNKLIVMKIEHK